MADFDVQQVVEAAARAQTVALGYNGWDSLPRNTQEMWTRATRAALAVIVPAVTEQVRALRHQVVAYDDFAMTSGRRECLCGRSDCPTVRKLDELDAAARGEQ